MGIRMSVRLGAFLAFSLSFLTPSFATGMRVVHSTRHDVSAPLRNLTGKAPAAAPEKQMHEPRSTGPALTSGKADPVAQQPIGSLAGVTQGLNFMGQSADDNRALLNGIAYVPPDTNAAVGAKQIVQTVNVSMAVYDKRTGALQLGPQLIGAVWSGFGGLCETSNGGDPVVLYDHLANRWIISQLGFNNSFSDNYQCVAVSTTADATGSYYRYAFPFGALFNDYPKFGIWPDAYYYSANMYGSKFLGALACALDKNAMLAGKPVAMICFQNDPSVASLLPADLDGKTLPPAGEPEPFVGIADTGHLNVFGFHADFANPSNSTFTGTQIAVAPFSEICARAVSLACVPEPSPGENVDALSDRLMFRLAYRNLGDHESLVVNHTVAGGPLAAVRWYEIRNPAAPFVYQQGTVYDPSVDYWLGSAAMDKTGDIALGFSASGQKLYPSVYTVARAAGDPLGSMSGPLVLSPGGGVQLNNSFKRWGDYSSMSVDPADDCTFWFAQEYYDTSGTIKWTTRIASFKFNNCK